MSSSLRPARIWRPTSATSSNGSLMAVARQDQRPRAGRRIHARASSAASPSRRRRPPPAQREFRIVADPTTGLRSATHFVGYIPIGRAPDHFHTYDEVIHVLDGEGVMHVGGEERPLGPGTAIELPARTVHCLENTGDRVMRVVAVFRPAGSPAAAYYPDGTPAHADAPVLETSSEEGAINEGSEAQRRGSGTGVVRRGLRQQQQQQLHELGRRQQHEHVREHRRQMCTRRSRSRRRSPGRSRSSAATSSRSRSSRSPTTTPPTTRT